MTATGAVVTWRGGVRFDVEIAFRGEPDAATRERLRRVVEGCTVHHTLTQAPEIRVTLAVAPVGASPVGLLGGRA